MKKLMIAAAIVCAAAFAQAGAVKWSAASLTESPATDFEKGATYTAYLFFGSDVTDATKYLAGEDYDLDAFASLAKTSRTASYDSAKEMLSFASASYGSFTSTEITAYMIVVDSDDLETAKNYLVMEKNESPYITQTFGTTGDKTYSWGNQGENTNWQSIPEPTSGLLLLLGVAGLALRRRRA